MQTLKQRIIAHIEASGPMTIASYMSWCLLDTTQGYYPTRDPLGIDGDFITAPEISQMFGELVGLWLLNSWREMGAPERVQLVEYGPGRGTLMSDIVRTARMDSGFLRALHISLIETSSALQGRQAQMLADCPAPVRWARSLEDVPPGPVLIIGNEYLDCLPVRQFIMQERFAGNDGWRERRVDIDPADPGRLRFTISAAAISKADQAALPSDLPDFKNGNLLEINMGLAQLIDSLQTRFLAAPGAALFIDYGPAETEYGDTLQALHKHEKQAPLQSPGNADLTARVDFAHLSQLAAASGLHTYGPVAQAQFLSRLGIEIRAAALARNQPEQKEKLARQLARLTRPDQMGTLFKAICIQSPSLAAPLGFEP